MSTVQLLPLEQLNASQRIAELEALQGEAENYANIGAPMLPGIPDIRQMILDYIDALVMKVIEEAKKRLMELLLMIAGGIVAAIIHDVNKVIEALNKVIRAINKAVDFFMPLARGIFRLIIALSIIYVVAKIITLVPSPGAGMGAVVVFDMFKSVAMEIMVMAGSLLDILWPVGFAIVAALFALVGLFAFLDLIRMFLNFMAAMQQDEENEAKAESVKTPADFRDTIAIDENSGEDDGGGQMVECTLPDGTVQQMSAEDCIKAGGTFPGMELLTELNELNSKINSMLEIVDCLLPDGTIEQLSLEECLARGGRALSQDELNKLLAQRDNLLNQLNNLSGLHLSGNQIMSLLNLNSDVTFESSTENTGKRYGFYQSEKDI